MGKEEPELTIAYGRIGNHRSLPEPASKVGVVPRLVAVPILELGKEDQG